MSEDIVQSQAADAFTSSASDVCLPALDQSLLLAALQSAPVALTILSVPDFRLTCVNTLMLDLIRKATNRQDVLGARLSEVAPAGIGGILQNWLSLVVETGAPQIVPDYPEPMPSGQAGDESGIENPRHWRFTSSPLFDSQSRVGSLLLVGEDTTLIFRSRLEAESLALRLKMANDSLSAANLGLQTILRQLPQGVVVIDDQARVTLTNRAAENILGVTLPTGSSFYAHPVKRLHSDGHAFIDSELPMKLSLEGKTLYGIEIVIVSPIGQTVHTLCSSAPLFNFENRVIGAVSIFQDITELRQLDRLKDEFLSIASHELKNPLTVVKGYVQLLGRINQSTSSPDNSRQLKILSVVERELTRLTDLTNVLLDVSRIQLGGLKLDLKPTELVGLVRRQIERVSVLAEQRRQVTLDCPLETIEGIWDRDRIEQVILNLIDNAIKYSPRGGLVKVTIRLVDESQVIVSIVDQGLGIPESDLERVFERFYRTEPGRSSGAPGTGLGLYVCRQIVTAHGGQIILESKVGQGSTFSVLLPRGLA